jgi:YVTN family beta-propeller protein
LFIEIALKTIMKKTSYLLTIAIMASAFGLQAQTKTGFHIIKDIPIGSSGGWDYITVDGSDKRMFVSHGSQVNILSTSGDSIGVIPNTAGVHGIALIKSLGKGYTSNGRSNSVSVFDLHTYKVLNDIPVGQNPDAIFYDDFSKMIITCNGRSKDATIIDPATNKVVATVALGDKPETAVSDGKGRIFVNGETTSAIIVFDAITYKEVARYKIDGGEEPTGLAINRTTNRLFIACAGSKTMVIMNAANGKTIAKFPIGDSDGLVFDPQSKIIYAANTGGTISAVREISADKYEFVETIASEASARTIGIDYTTHHLFLPAAKTEPNPAGGRAKQIPGSFHVIEVGK